MKTVYKERAWYRLPFIRITIALIIGTILGNLVSLPTMIVKIGIAIGTILLIGFHLSLPATKFSYHWLGGLIIHFIFILLGWNLIQSAKQIPSLPSTTPLIATITAPLSTTKQSLKTVGEIGKTKLMLYFQQDSMVAKMKIGAQIALLKNPERIVEVYNPGGFNYKAYAASQQLFYQCYLKKEDYKLINNISPTYKEQIITAIQTNLLNTIQAYIKGPKEKAIAEALLIGYKKNLDPELLQAYSNTGVVHIIAISGMHLGMIYGLLLFILNPLSKTSAGNWLKLAIMLLVIWTFTLLTGAAASILRSAIMFSFIIIGQPYQKKAPIYNSIAASAFCILLYNPLQLWDIGFQLSYAAVIAIVAFSKPLSHLVFAENKLLRYAWQLTAVTLAAQIGTIPLLLFYFHQFPNLFIFSNFIAVPLSGLILYTEILLMLISPIHSMARFTGQIIEFLIGFMNRIIENTARIPFAVTQGIQIDVLQTAVLYTFIVLMAIWLFKKNKPSFIVALLCASMFFGIHAFSKIKAANQQKLIVYYAPKKAAADIFIGRKHCYIGDNSIYHASTANSTFIKNYLTPTRILYRATTAIKPTALPFLMHINSSPMIIGPNKRVLVVNPKFKIPNHSPTHEIDLIILSGNPNISLENLSAFFINARFVFDCSNPLWKIQLWKKQAERLHLRHHSVPQQGAFEMNL
jgi:competence protein ComEC